ncbi:MAG: adenylate/guanylate cyclase domain-containing protein [Thermodesulfobacteriota bacterium]
MAEQEIPLTILFADIAKSTHLYEILGDVAAQKIIGVVLANLSQVAERHRGKIVKTIGDAVMCTFTSVNDAVEAAWDMQVTIGRLGFLEYPQISSLNIYVGLHSGLVVEREGDVFGDAVNVAARMAEIAKPRQILTTEKTVSELAPELAVMARCADTTTLKGKTGEVKIFEVVWEQQDQTVMVDGLLDSHVFRLRLELRLGNDIIEVDQNRPIVTLGRQSHNDLVVDDSRVSRSHARVEYRRGKFVLVDQSSNGTFVLPTGGKTTRLRRDEAPLLGHGLIGLGKPPDPDSPDSIHFMIKT